MTRTLLGCLATLALATTANAQFSMSLVGPGGTNFQVGGPASQHGHAHRGPAKRVGQQTILEEVQETYVVETVGPDGRRRQEERLRTIQVPRVVNVDLGPAPQPSQPRLQTRKVRRIAYDQFGRPQEITEQIPVTAPRHIHNQPQSPWGTPRPQPTPQPGYQPISLHLLP